MEENLEKLEEFFTRDRIIKEMLMEAKNVGINDQAGYFEKIDNLMEDIEFEFYRMMQWNELGPIMGAAVNQKIVDIKKSVQREGSSNVINRKYFSGMDEKLVDDVKNAFKGYVDCNPLPLIDRCTSVNELLHVVHSYVVNNDELLQRMPMLAQKPLEGYSIQSFNKIVLYGNLDNINDFAKSLFVDFPNNISGPVDIIGLDNRTLVMVRDRGHAMSIEVDSTEKDQNPIVRYHIPKICNKDKVNKLRGVQKVNTDDFLGATKGKFVLKDVNSTKELIDFIQTVPTDADIQLESFSIDEEISKTVIQNSKPGIKPLFEIADAEKLSETRSVTGIQKGLGNFKSYIKSILGKENNREGNNVDGRY